MRLHSPPCPDVSAPDREAAHTAISHPGQGWSLLCNGIVIFEDTGELLPVRHDHRARPADRPDLRPPGAVRGRGAGSDEVISRWWSTASPSAVRAGCRPHPGQQHGDDPGRRASRLRARGQAPPSGADQWGLRRRGDPRHGDATPANFLFGDHMDVAAIDLERMKRGDRMFDVGRVAA